MKRSICAGDLLRFDATVTRVEGGWVDLDVVLTVDGAVATECAARIAVPTGDEDDPWERAGDDWRP
jgi:hypothetical protein